MTLPPYTVADALRRITADLTEAAIPDAPGDARRLMAHALGCDSGRLTLLARDPLPLEAAARLDAALSARLARRPVAQIIGQRLFWGRSFRVTQDTLDPRPETETLIAAALEAPFSRLLDLGTGTGVILLTLLAEQTDATGLGTDRSAAALAVARSNAQALGLTDRARLIEADWFDAINGHFDLIISNPPYIAADEMPGLSPEVRLWEPAMALTDGGDGLGAYRAIAGGAAAHLTGGGRLLVEIGPTQTNAVGKLFAEAGLVQIATLKDLDGRDRVISAVLPA
ncbi:peptide chain release factor N(5)-glutamine methyltransferase [Paracoccus suum]|uniref:Release factor glutamine methyltransferase n=1 Tax=Paracoccus suum TaxID=2259340 RepID=A0A344PGH6_9RHOB|nr:peptide chain release factor N(5)-glutamine methyltransferase [Paracoccus suum]AXC48481.1 peptide chain release factor N(5)-glutamine methyltransferase [Paracoccus suum]